MRLYCAATMIIRGSCATRNAMAPPRAEVPGVAVPLKNSEVGGAPKLDAAHLLPELVVHGDRRPSCQRRLKQTRRWLK
jgi:hypothetical protein